MRTIKIIIINAIYLLLFQSCVNDSNKIDYNYLSYISKAQPVLPPVEILVPVHKDGDKYEVFFDNYLFFQCVFKSKDYGYEEYLRKLYSNEITITYDSIKKFPHTIVKKTAIWEKYKEKGLNIIIEKYLEATRDSSYCATNKISNEELDDLMRILFINSYLIDFDDVWGRYYFTKYK